MPNIRMEPSDDDLIRFEVTGASPLPQTESRGYVEHDGAHIWYATFGSGVPVILLHGGFGNSENWGYQVPALVASGYRAVLIDSRGHGRSTRDPRPFTYERMAADVFAIIDALRLDKAALVGWSDGATIALVLAKQQPARVAGVFAFGGNMDLAGVRQISEPAPLLRRIFARHAKDYTRLSATPDEFGMFAAAVDTMMKTQPNYSAADLAKIRVPVTIAQSEREEFILPEHADYLAGTIPGAKLIVLRDVSHFAPLQRPQRFNTAMLAFLGEIFP